MDTDRNILQSIGNTSLVQLHHVVPPDCGKVFAKLEWQNPTGSMKDRMALSVISRAGEDGRLSPGGTVVEYTGGSTGASLALVCAAKGYRIHVVSSKAFSQEKLDNMVSYGAQLTLVPTDASGFTKQLFLDMIEAARQIAVAGFDRRTVHHGRIGHGIHLLSCFSGFSLYKPEFIIWTYIGKAGDAQYRCPDSGRGAGRQDAFCLG